MSGFERPPLQPDLPQNFPLVFQRFFQLDISPLPMVHVSKDNYIGYFYRDVPT